jgi:hypothetical protein
MSTCSIEGCDKPAKSKGMCWTHVKRKQRGSSEAKPVRGYGMPHQTKLTLAATRYADAGDDEEYERARLLLKKYASSNGAKQRLRTIIEEVVHAAIAKFLGQSTVRENVQK